MLAKIESNEPENRKAGSLRNRYDLIQQIALLTQRLEEYLKEPDDSALSKQTPYENARMWLRKQNARYKYLPKSLFRDPAWNILLDLYVQEKDGRAVSVTSACVASGGASTTALRWIANLEDAGLVNRISDTIDGRRSFIRLTSKARVAIESWLADTH